MINHFWIVFTFFFISCSPSQAIVPLFSSVAYALFNIQIKSLGLCVCVSVRCFSAIFTFCLCKQFGCGCGKLDMYMLCGVNCEY